MGLPMRRRITRQEELGGQLIRMVVAVAVEADRLDAAGAGSRRRVDPRAVQAEHTTLITSVP